MLVRSVGLRRGGAFTPPGPGGGPDGTSYYIEITVSAARVTSALANFPVYLDLAHLPEGFWEHVQVNGGDIRVTRSDGVTRCPADLVTIDKIAKAGELHFLAHALSNVADNVFRIYYGHGSLSQPAASHPLGRNAVWADYEFVTHDGGRTDSTGRYTMSVGGSSVTPGKLGSASAFTDTARNISAEDVTRFTGQSPLTWSAWFRRTRTFTNPTPRMAHLGLPLDVFLATPTNPEIMFRIGHGGQYLYKLAYFTPTLDAWHHLVGTHDGAFTVDGMKLYRAGARMTERSSQGAATLPISKLRVGNADTDLRGMIGAIDEFRLALVERSATWIATEYANQNDASAFYDVGPERDTTPPLRLVTADSTTVTVDSTAITADSH